MTFATPKGQNVCIINSRLTLVTIKRSNYYMVPTWCQKNPHLVGRSSILRTLHNMLHDESPMIYNHRVALFGLGGVGKTQIAIEYVVTQRNTYDAIFWITATDLSSLLLGFQNIAKETGCVHPDESNSREVAA